MKKQASNMNLFPCDLSPTIENIKFPSLEVLIILGLTINLLQVKVHNSISIL